MTTISGGAIEPSRHGDEQSFQIDIDERTPDEVCLNIKGFIWKKGYVIDRECAIYFIFKGQNLDRLIDGLVKARDEQKRGQQ